MTPAVAILVPVLGRPHRVAPLLQAFTDATPEPHRVLFITDPHDTPTHQAIREADGWMIAPGGGYAAKIRAGVEVTDEPLVFLGADDLTPQPGWLEAARLVIGAGAHVVGVNDLIPRRRHHATHFLLTREYALRPTIDGQPGPLSQAYTHSFCDDELIATAQHRGVYAYAAASHVRHDHPMCGTAEDDDTYRLGRAQFRRDRRVFEERGRLWT